jgi:hypothetical protein
MECPWGVPTIPKVLHKSMEWFGRSRVAFGGVDPRILFIPERPSLTDLTGAAHRPDRCRRSVGFASGECLGEFVVVLCSYCFEFGSVWSSVGLFGGFGVSWLEPVWLVSYNSLTGVGAFCGSSQVLPLGTSLTGGAHQLDRYRSVALELCFVAFSSPWRWLLVPRISSTPMAAWSWPTWVVKSETWFGSLVRLVGVLISFEKNFHRLPFTPPSGSANRSFNWYHRQFGSLLTLASIRSKDGIPGTGFGSSALRWEELPDVAEANGSVPPRKGSDPLGRYGEHILCSSD